ncbi:MAG: serine/threonine-protein kinase [Planctomycetota bacterium]
MTNEKIELTFEDIALKNRILQEVQIKRIRDQLSAAGRDVYEPQEFATAAIGLGLLTETETITIMRALERLRRDQIKDEKVVYDSIYIPGYQIVGKLGDGAIGTVFKARQISMKRVVALKILHKQWLNDEEFKRRFLIEARAAGKLSHQNLIQVFDVGRFNDRYYFSMEFVDGQTVQNLIDFDGRVDLKLTIDIALQVNRALFYISQYNLVHRDIKPANIMITGAGVAKVGDFGFLYAAEESKIAQAGMTLGTPDYISPEQAMGSASLGIRSDIYSLGATMFHMLSGNTVFTGSGSEVMSKHVDAKLPDLRKYLADLPEEVVSLIAKMMDKKAEDRYSCEELFEQLEYLKTYCEADSLEGAVPGGRTTLFNAFNMGKLRVARLERQNRQLKDQGRRFFRLVCILGGLSAALLAVIIILLVKRLT